MDSRPILLVAEKDDDCFQLMKKQLRDAGCGSSIVRFGNGQALLDFLTVAELAEHLSTSTFIMLINMDMPESSGVEVLRKIKKNKKLKGIPAIMMLEDQDPAQVTMAHSIGCGGFIRKPVKVEDLFSAFEKLNINLVSKEIREHLTECTQ